MATSYSFAGTSSSNIVINNATQIQLGTGDYTIEWWQYQTDSNSFPRVFQIGNYPNTNVGVSIEGGIFYYWSAGSANAIQNLTSYAPISNVYKNKWLHFAISRINPITRIFLNGQLLGYLNDTSNLTGSLSLVIGNESTPSSGAAFGGQIVGFHFVKGVGLYSSNFPTPTTLPTAGANTILLFNNSSVSPTNPNNLTITNTTTTSVNMPNVTVSGGSSTIPCFLEGTKILCQINDENIYVPIEQLTKGMLVRTFRQGYVPVSITGKKTMYNPATDIRDKDRLFVCTKNNYPEITEDLIITGCHSILEYDLQQEVKDPIIEILGDLYMTEDLYRIPACVDMRANIYVPHGTYTIWHVALENTMYVGNYGIYANGLLVESCSERYLKEVSGMDLVVL